MKEKIIFESILNTFYEVSIFNSKYFSRQRQFAKYSNGGKHFLRELLMPVIKEEEEKQDDRINFHQPSYEHLFKFTLKLIIEVNKIVSKSKIPKFPILKDVPIKYVIILYTYILTYIICRNTI